MVLLTSNFIYAIYINRMEGMLLIDWQVFGLSINLAGAGKYNSNIRVVFSTSLQNRYNLATIKLKRDLKSENIGKISLVDCTMIWHRNYEYYKNGWRGRYALDGGVLTNQAIHLLDMLIYNFGKIKYFDVIADFNKKKLEAEDLIITNFKHENGILSSFKATTRANRNGNWRYDNSESERFQKIRDWAGERGLYTKGDTKTQFCKLMEEAGELGRAVLKDDKEEFVDAIGDMVVVLTNMAHLGGTTIEECIDTAYKVIAKRTGKMVNGTFVKDA